jgi:hypothetical protein
MESIRKELGLRARPYYAPSIKSKYFNCLECLYNLLKVRKSEFADLGTELLAVRRSMPLYHDLKDQGTINMPMALMPDLPGRRRRQPAGHSRSIFERAHGSSNTRYRFITHKAGIPGDCDYLQSFY